MSKPHDTLRRMMVTVNADDVLSLPETNRLAWWNANKDIYSDTGLTTPAADGGTVGGWKDQGSSGYHVTQSTAGDQPIYRKQVTALRSKPAIEFVSSDFLIRTGLSASIVGSLSVYSLYVIFVTVNAGLITPYSEGNSGAATPFVSANTNGAQVTFSHRDGVGVIASSGGGTTANNGAAHILTIRRIAATSWSLRLDGAEVGTDTDNVGATSINQVAIGCFARVTNSQFYVGHIAQIAAYSADNFAAIEPLLAAFYGIALP